MFNPKYSRSVTFSASRPSALPICKCEKRPPEHPGAHISFTEYFLQYYRIRG